MSSTHKDKLPLPGPQVAPVGPEAVTADEAAQILGVSKRSVFRYAKGGLLRRIQNDISTYYVRADLHALAPQIKNGRLPRSSTLRLSVLQDRFEEATDTMDAINFGLDAQRPPLKLSDDEARSLFLSVQSFADSEWPPGSERQLVTILQGLCPETVQQFERVTETKEAWRPFLALASRLEEAVADSTLAMLCYAARAHVRSVAKLCIQHADGSRAWQRELRHLAGVDRNQLRRAARTNQNISPPKPDNDVSDVNRQLRDALAAFEKQQANRQPA